MSQTLERYSPDSDLTDRRFEWNLASAPAHQSGRTDRDLSRQPIRRSRPLTFIQEALFFAVVFVIGGVLQALVLLDIAGVIE
jgi:hypothetical protein